MANKKLKKVIKRRRNGEGSVVSRSDGRFQASQMINGKRIYFYSRNEAECYHWLDEMKVRRMQGMPVTSGDIELSLFVQSYIQRYAKPYVRTSTLKNYLGYSDNYIACSGLGKMKVSRICADDVQDFINELADKGISGKTISNIGSFLDSVFSQAVRNRLIWYNPCECVRYPKKQTEERPLISEEEFERLVDSAETQTMRTAISILGEGLRIGELLGLQWSDLIDVEGVKVLSISKSLKREYLFDDKQEKMKGTKTEIMISDTKTDSSVRQVPILPNVLTQLEKLKAEQHTSAAQLGIKFDDECFIIGSIGKDRFTYTTPDKFRSEFTKCVRRAGLPKKVTPHALRRYTASTLIRHGANPVAVAKLLGHSSSSTTLTFYSRENLKGTLEAVMLLDRK